jgi:hypothetical protein
MNRRELIRELGFTLYSQHALKLWVLFVVSRRSAPSNRVWVGQQQPGQASHGQLRLSHVTRHTSHVTRHTSHVTRHTSLLTRELFQLISELTVGCAVVQVEEGSGAKGGSLQAEAHQRVQSWVRGASPSACDL